MEIPNTYILRSDGPIWLTIQLRADATIEKVEDHDHHSGGVIDPIKNETQEQLFVRRARERGFSLEEIYSFLEGAKENTRLWHAPKKTLQKTVHYVMLQNERDARINYHRRMADYEQSRAVYCSGSTARDSAYEMAREHIACVFMLEMNHDVDYKNMPTNPTRSE